MGLTSITLLLLAAAVAAGATTALCVFWNRLADRRRPVRVVGILLSEALLLFTFGLLVNRIGGFYPSWAALTMATPAIQPAPAAPPPQPAWLSAYRAAQSQAERGRAFAWQSGSRTAWGLSAAPMVWLPTDTLPSATDAHVSERVAVPVTVVLLPKDAAAPSIPHTGTSAVVVLRLADPPRPAALAAGLAVHMSTELPVESHSWTAIGVGPACAAAVALLTDEPNAFHDLALVPGPVVLAPRLVQRARSEAQEMVVARTGLGAALAWADRMAPADLAPGYVLPTAEPTTESANRHGA
jgi:hypothetical protein